MCQEPGARQQRLTLSWKGACTEILQFSDEAGVRGSLVLAESPAEEAADFIIFYSHVILW